MTFKDKLNRVHFFSINGDYLLFDVSSGSLHLIDEEAFQALTALKEGKEFTSPPAKEVMTELEQLEKEGLLFTPENKEVAEFKFNNRPLKSLCLHVAHKCNLKCRYCFGSQGCFGGKEELMPLDTALQSVDYLLERSGSRCQCEIDFFGGEPLLNFPVVKETVEYAEKVGSLLGKKFTFTLTTNGLLLGKEVLEFLGEHNINLVLSLDGSAATHDRLRYFAGGQGSFASVYPKIKEAVEFRKSKSYYTYVRGTFTALNLDITQHTKDLLDLGLEYLSLEPVVTTDEELRIREEHLPKLYQEYEDLVLLYHQCKQAFYFFTFFHFEVNFQQGQCLPRRLAGCGAGRDYLAVTPEGDLYPCHQFVGREKYRLGNLHCAGVPLKAEVKELFAEIDFRQKEGCPSCWARFYCSGGCHANSDLMTENILKPDPIGCQLQKKRLECALWLEAQKVKGQA